MFVPFSGGREGCLLLDRVNGALVDGALNQVAHAVSICGTTYLGIGNTTYLKDQKEKTSYALGMDLGIKLSN